jgi:hypothetical protein
MNFCNYNKNIILLYALKTLVARDINIDWDVYGGDYLFFYWWGLGFTLNNGWVNFEENSVRYRFSTNCPIANVFRWCKFYLTIYWWRYGKG